jgi:hypothetical protein
MKFSTLLSFLASVGFAFAAPTLKRDPSLKYLIVKEPSTDVQVGPPAEIIAASLDGHVQPYLTLLTLSIYITGMSRDIPPEISPSGLIMVLQAIPKSPNSSSTRRTTASIEPPSILVSISL